MGWSDHPDSDSPLQGTRSTTPNFLLATGGLSIQHMIANGTDLTLISGQNEDRIRPRPSGSAILSGPQHYVYV